VSALDGQFITVTAKLYGITAAALAKLDAAGVELVKVDGVLAPVQFGDSKKAAEWLKAKKAERKANGKGSAKWDTKVFASLASMIERIEKFSTKHADEMPIEVKDLFEMAITATKEAERKMLEAKKGSAVEETEPAETK
jgi:hypothetical protein